MITIGIDAGTSKWAISVLEECEKKGKTRVKFIYQTMILTHKIKNDVNGVLNLIEKFHPTSVVCAFGYGLPLKKASELTSDDLFKISLKNENEKESIGIRKFLTEVKKRKFKAYVVPSVKQLPTVENFKKVNVIDMGTSDKLCSAIYALSLSKNFKKENFILVEIGYGFNAFLKICEGKICDGIGGTIASSGFLSHGKTDSEINWKVDKFSGGVLKIIKRRVDAQKISSDVFFKEYKKFENGELAYLYFVEGIIKDISALMDIKISKIYLCGKISMFVEGEVKDRLESRFERKFTVENIELNAKGSVTSKGGAILANGIEGGKFKNLIEWTKIKNAKEDIFDYVFV